MALLAKDPTNVIITGVGGQGNVLASRILGNLLSMQGLSITIGETFGASQRGGSVASHLRVSAKGAWSPQIPKGRADLVVALEPIEALRILAEYGNKEVTVITNTRSIFPVGCISGELAYPTMDQVKGWLNEFSKKAYFIDATNEAMKLGSPIFGNIMMIGALSAVGTLPVTREGFFTAVSAAMAASKVDINMQAFDIGVAMIQN
ncbi:MAG: indolepyruvate oxidoreductase subunit beta [Thermodesulfobacteriota bacterium]